MPVSNVKSFLAHLTEQSGVYQIVDAHSTTLYVGKARNLKKRVSQYFHKTITNPKTSALMQQADRIDITITQTETEALLLENNLIKSKKPRYNVLLKDDKSYPYIFLSKGEFSRLDFYRGNKKEEGRYFGPYPSAAMVRKILNLLYKLFKIRQCEDSFFKHRQRPCLQYYIDRCTAPCVGYVDSEAYQQQVKDAILFLEGKNRELLQLLEQRMQAESSHLNYEKARMIRDQIKDLKEIQEKQYVVDQSGEFDIITLVEHTGLFCLGVLRIRDGCLLDHTEYFPSVPAGTPAAEVLGSFLGQYYLNKVPVSLWPKNIALNISIKEIEALEALFSEHAEKKIRMTVPKRGKVYEWVRLSLSNANYATQHRLATKSSYQHQVERLQALLGMSVLPKRIECFDISHTAGEGTIASNVVFGLDGPIKNEYRRFLIQSKLAKGDDYGAMREVLGRRYGKCRDNPERIPNLVMVDGGKGQLNIAVELFNSLGIEGVTLIGIAKGEGRKPGLEKIWQPGKNEPIYLTSDSVVLHLLQRIRDEAHRFAIIGHRQVRDKKRSQSFLEEIPGVGPKRRRLLLSTFGGLQQLKQASVERLSSLPGMNEQLAQRIYDYLHEQ